MDTLIAADFAAVASILVDGTCAWQTPDLISRRAGWEIENCLDRLCDLDVAGLIAVWADHDPLVVTLTPLAAELLGVRLVGTTHHEVYRWSADAATARTRRATRAQLKRMEDHDALLREIPEPPRSAPSRAHRVRGPIDPPRPTVLLFGHTGWPWEEMGNHSRKVSPLCPDCSQRRRRLPPALAKVCRTCGRGFGRRPRSPVCPGCKGRPLNPDWYCLRCDRWGRDGYYARRQRPDRGAD